MVSFEKICQKLLQVDEYLGLLRKISKTPVEAFLKDKIVIGSAKYYLQVSIEGCLDVANHIIASEQMAKFRNRLVHLYGEIDDAYVYEFMKKDLKDIEEFKSIIIKRYKP